jgi:ribonuclease VapC
MIGTEHCLIGWPTVFEAHLVLTSLRRRRGDDVLEKILAAPHIDMIAFDRRIFELAAAAFDRYGRGRHRAKLNFGDCMAYAVARAHEVPLLYKGGDFARTDIAAALP